MHPKKVLPKKLIFLGIGKIVFWLKLFLGALFTKVICTLLKSVWKDGFLMPQSTYSKQKIFISNRDNVENLKGKKWKPVKIVKNCFFYKQILNFLCPSKILCHTSKLWNFVKITGPYYTLQSWNSSVFNHFIWTLMNLRSGL